MAAMRVQLTLVGEEQRDEVRGGEIDRRQLEAHLVQVFSICRQIRLGRLVQELLRCGAEGGAHLPITEVDSVEET